MSISHHDAGWFDFDRDPKIDPATGLPYNLVETPPEFITDDQQALARFQSAPASLLRVDFQHAQLGPLQRTLRPFQARAARQDRGKRPAARRQDAEWRARAPEASQGGACAGSRSARLARRARRFSRTTRRFNSSTRSRCISTESTPANASSRYSRTCRCRASEDVTVTIRPVGANTYQLSPFPFAASGAEFAFCGRRISPADGKRPGGWPAALRNIPTEWENFRLVAG